MSSADKAAAQPQAQQLFRTAVVPAVAIADLQMDLSGL